jgi:hypothetical protein
VNCAICGRPAAWNVWGVALCGSDYAAWAADLPGCCDFVRESLTHAQYVTRSVAQARDFVARRKARTA